jgi:pimeloyl-ACP methyl ester carboxylesterase
MTTGEIVLLVFAAVVTVVLANIALEFIARRRHPPLGKFIELEGVRLHYLERGPPDGPVLVMLHGNGTLLQDLALSGLVDAAAQKFRVICFDRPGFGYSSRPRSVIWSPDRQGQLLCDALSKIGVTQAVVLGHSWGTLVALAMAARNDHLVRGLVLISGYYFPTWRVDVMIASVGAIPIVGDVLRYTVSPISSWLALPLFAKKVFAPTSVPDIVKREYPRLLLVRPGQLRAVAEDSAFMVPAAGALSLAYKRIRCPTAIVAGREDQIVKSEQAKHLKLVLPHAEITSVPESGHMVHYSVSMEIAQTADAVRAQAGLASVA